MFIVAGCTLYFLLAWGVITNADTGDSPPDWSSPNAKTLKKISDTATAQTSPNLFDNMDCSLVTYRLPTTSTMSTGCFTPSAMGWMEADSDLVIYNGTDEALPLTGFSAHQVLVPWPMAGAILALDPVNTGGHYVGMYINPTGEVNDHRDLLFRLTSKELKVAPDIQLKDKQGNRLVINPQSLTFSDGGAWMVAETLNGAFVRINLATLTIKPFAPSYTTSGSPAALKSRLAISDDGDFVAIYNNEASVFKVFDLNKCALTAVNLEPENCTAYDYLPFVKSQVAGLQSIRHVRFVNDSLLSFEVNSSSVNQSGTYEMAPRAGITSLIDYLGLGDSYTSGEGAFDYVLGTDTADNHCHLSINSYPFLLTHDLFSARGGHSVACSGAVIKDIVGRKGQGMDKTLKSSVLINFLPGYVSQKTFVKQWQPEIITVSIGGNDIGFGDILETCVVPHISIHRTSNDCFSTYEDRQEILDRIDKTLPEWVHLLGQLKKASPHSRIYIVGYPQIAYDQGSCALNVHLSRSEIAFAADIVDYINETVSRAATQTNVQYADISQALVGHRLCETASYNIAVNGLTAGRDSLVLGRESYHPNALGHQLIEEEIIRQTHRLTLGTTASTGSRTRLLAAPKSGRKTTTKRPAALTTKKLAKGGKAKVKVTGIDHALNSGGSYTVHLDGPDGPVIGGGTAGSSGDLDIDVTIPPTTGQGGHTVDVVGDNQAGETVDISQPVYVPESDTDADGDGVPDSGNSCPMAVNNGQDADHDGIDDVCDPLITSGTGQTGSTSASGSVSTTTNSPTETNASSTPNIPSSGTSTNNQNSSSGTAISNNIPPTTSNSIKQTSSKPKTIGQIAAGQIGSKTINNQKANTSSSLFADKSLKHVRQIQIKTVVFWIFLVWLVLILAIWLLGRRREKRTQPVYRHQAARAAE